MKTIRRSVAIVLLTVAAAMAAQEKLPMPDFTKGGYEASFYSSANISTTNQDGLAPELHVATIDTPAEVVFKVVTPFYLTSGTFDGAFEERQRVETRQVADVWSEICGIAGREAEGVFELGSAGEHRARQRASQRYGPRHVPARSPKHRRAVGDHSSH